MKSLGEKHRYFDRPKGVGVEAGVGLETLLLAESAVVARARGLALVMALGPSDFVASSGDGEEAQDVYAAVYAGRHLRIGLGTYRFAGQPPILMVTITALPAAEGA